MLKKSHVRARRHSAFAKTCMSDASMAIPVRSVFRFEFNPVARTCKPFDWTDSRASKTELLWMRPCDFESAHCISPRRPANSTAHYLKGLSSRGLCRAQELTWRAWDELEC